MGIDAYVEDENGNKIHELGDPKSYFAKAVTFSQTTNFNFIKCIDPYGDTVFNTIQIPSVIEELKGLKLEIQEPLTKDHIEKLIFLAKKINAPHYYLKFYGD